MPTSIRVAAITMGVLAALLLVNAGLLWYAFDVTVDRIVDAGHNITEDEARRFVLLALIPYLVIGLVLALAAWFLPRRQPWARWIGLAASVVLGLLTLFSMVAAGGITISSLLLFVLSAAAVASLLARTSGTWVPPLRSRG
jgi:glucan phosphoethanolaminetransferase (alkaline phosphatase superfamily)